MIASDRLAKIASRFIAKKLGQAKDVLPSLSEWGQLQANVVDALVQITPELALLDLSRQIGTGGEDESNVNRDWRPGAERLDLAIAEHLKESSLETAGQRPNLVEQDRTAVGPKKAPRAFGRGIFLKLLAKQFTFQAKLVDPFARDLDERLIPPAALLVDHPGDQGFAGPLLADDQDRRLRRCDRGGKARRLAESRVFADKLRTKPLGLRAQPGRGERRPVPGKWERAWSGFGLVAPLPAAGNLPRRPIRWLRSEVRRGFCSQAWVTAARSSVAGIGNLRTAVAPSRVASRARSGWARGKEERPAEPGRASGWRKTPVPSRRGRPG